MYEAQARMGRNAPWPSARRADFPSGVNFPFREPPCPGLSLLPEWLRSPKPSVCASATSSPRQAVFPERSILPSTSLNNEAAAADMLTQQQKLPFGVPWDKAESKKVEAMPPPPPEPQQQQQQQCSTKLFGFNLAACPARSHVSDSEGSGPWPSTDDPSPMSVDQHVNRFAAGTSSTVTTVPMRTGTKVSSVLY